MSAAAAAPKSLQSCPTLCDPTDGIPPGSPVPGILQAKTLEWVAISFSNAWKWKVKVKSLSRIRLFVTPWTAAYQVPSSKGFSRQEYWSGLPLPSLNICLPHSNFRKFVWDPASGCGISHYRVSPSQTPSIFSICWVFLDSDSEFLNLPKWCFQWIW